MSYYSILVNQFRGEVLKLKRVQRHQMGAYLCIASNSVPPSVSKRIRLNVNCKLFFNLIPVWILLPKQSIILQKT